MSALPSGRSRTDIRVAHPALPVRTEPYEAGPASARPARRPRVAGVRAKVPPARGTLSSASHGPLCSIKVCTI